MCVHDCEDWSGDSAYVRTICVAVQCLCMCRGGGWGEGLWSSTDNNGIKRIVYSMSGGHMLKRGHM